MDENLRSKFRAAHENEILLGQQSGTITGLQERSATAKGSRLEQVIERQRNANTQSADLLQLIDQIRLHIELLEQQISELEQGFQAKYSDAWREQIALKVLGEDGIPRRREGESIEDYRARLEKTLIKEMLNPDGSIKKKYLDDPTLLIYAQWAQKKYNLSLARENVAELENPATTPERQQEIFDGMAQRRDLEEITFAEQEAAKRTTQGQVKDVADQTRDSATAQTRAQDVGVAFKFDL